MDGQPTKTLATTDTALTSDMNLVDAYPRLDQAFAYEGLGSDLDYGFPGSTWSQACGWDMGCWVGNPGTTEQMNALREKPYGLGQASSGKYDTDAGGWHSFGGQGQSTVYHSNPYTWRPWNSENCEDR